MADKNFNTVTIAPAANAADYLHITTAGGTHNRLQMQKLIDLAKADALSSTQAALLDKIADGCFIMHHRSTDPNDNFPVACKPSEWTAKQNRGEIADGVLVICGDKHIVVAPTGGASMRWGSNGALIAGAGNYSMDREWALAHFDGKACTSAIVSSAAYAGDSVDYAPGFCNAYSRTNANGHGLTAGRWWLPSMGELAIMWQYRQRINLCLELITGGQRLADGGYWSSSEYSANYAWFLSLSVGYMNVGQKVDRSYFVRPVSAFLN